MDKRTASQNEHEIRIMLYGGLLDWASVPHDSSVLWADCGVSSSKTWAYYKVAWNGLLIYRRYVRFSAYGRGCTLCQFGPFGCAESDAPVTLSCGMWWDSDDTGVLNITHCWTIQHQASHTALDNVLHFACSSLNIGTRCLMVADNTPCCSTSQSSHTNTLFRAR